MIDKESFSNWLLQQITERGISQSELARRAGLNRAVISKVINQMSEPTPDTIKAIALGLDLSTDIVLRAAGVLAQVPEKRTRVEELAHLAQELSDDDIDDLIALARLRGKKREKQDVVHAQKSSRSYKPARSVSRD